MVVLRENGQLRCSNRLKLNQNKSDDSDMLSYDSGFVNHGHVLYNTYSFDAVKGTLTNRQNLVLGINENFTYDNLDRLLSWTKPLTAMIDSNVYDDSGRITTNNKLGLVNYNTDLATGIYKKSNVKLNTEGQAYYGALGGSQQVSYTMFKSPISITESGKGKIDFIYNAHLSRSKMLYDYGLIAPSTTKVQRKTKLFTDDGSTEILFDALANTIKIRTFVGGDAYSAPLLVKSDGTTQNNFYLHRDYQNTILVITNQAGQVVEKRLFDAWGVVLKVKDGAGTVLPKLTFIDRGYTGHEHLHSVGLINMNARLYDPKLHRFLSPDNYVQDPSNTQSFNRYGYCINNPLKYTDKNGEFFSFITAIFDGVANAFTHGVNFNSYDWTRTQNAWKIDAGLFQGNIGQIASRFTFESIQSGAGYVFSGIHNLFGGVKSVTYYGGATAVESYSPTIFNGGGFTLGSFINGREDLQADPSNSLFQHEYGHYLQSQATGLFYLPKFAIPSLIDTFGKGNHHLHFAEQDANSRAFTYFNNHVENYNANGTDWDRRNTIVGYNWNRPFNDIANQLALSNNLTHLKWYDFVLLPTTGIFITGIANQYVNK